MSAAYGARALFGCDRSAGSVDSLKKLNPALMMKNPVMFVVEVGSVVTTVLLFKGGRALQVQPADHAVAVVHGAVCELCRGDGGGPRQGAGGRAAQGEERDDGVQAEGQRQIEEVPSSHLRVGDKVRVVRGADDSRRRRGD
jgi:potassium-transporting ATPase ATP-binding subunit